MILWGFTTNRTEEHLCEKNVFPKVFVAFLLKLSYTKDMKMLPLIDGAG